MRAVSFRLLVLGFVLGAVLVGPGITRAHAEPAASRWFASASLGVHHTSVERGNGAPDTSGPRFALAARFAPHPAISIVAIGAVSRYRDNHVYDAVTMDRYALHVTDLWLGGRALVHPVPRLWIGLGLSAVGERERSSREDKPEWLTTWTPELILGWQMISSENFGIQLETTWGRYARFYDLEHVEFWTLGLGVEY